MENQGARECQGVMTRSQTKKMRENFPNRQISVAKRKSTTRESFMSVGDENLGMFGQCAGAVPSGRKSFPLESDSDSCRDNGSKKMAKTDMSARQKRGLADMGGNAYVFQSGRCAQVPDPSLSGTYIIVAPQSEHHNDLLQHATEDEVFAAPSEPVVWRPERVQYAHMSTDDVIPQSPMDCVAPLTPAPSPQYFIPDIDANPDSLNTTVYSRDILKYMFSLEGNFVLAQDFLDRSPDVTSRMRGVLMDWLLQVQSHEELSEETLHLSVAFIDQYLSAREVVMPKLQLVGITCMLIAAKFCERFAPNISVLCYLTADTFVRDQVLEFERQVLEVLDFQVSRPVSTYFLNRFFQVHHHSREIEVLSNYILDLSITQVSLVPVLPSLKAASALYLARHLHPMVHEQVWTPEFVYYTNYTSQDLKEVVAELAMLLVKAPDSKFQGARIKYSSADLLCVSKSPEVSPSWVLLRQFGKVMS